MGFSAISYIPLKISWKLDERAEGTCQERSVRFITCVEVYTIVFAMFKKNWSDTDKHKAFEKLQTDLESVRFELNDDLVTKIVS